MMLEVKMQPQISQVRVCTIDELPIGLGRAFNVADREIALFRTRRGNIFAVDNLCPHKGGPLAEGILAGDVVVCPLHAFRFEVASGECDQPGTCPVGRYAVTQDGNDVYIAVPNSAVRTNVR
jgi:nitrite reductase (NADH) small subunit